VKGKRFFPLDHKLHLRADHWSEGAARVVTRQGLQAKSFDLAAEAYAEAVGGEISADSLRRVTEGWGTQVETQRTAEAERANTVAQRGESPQTQRVAEVAPIAGQANVSTDGTMILVRTESWKEVKLAAISAVTVKPVGERGVDQARPSRRDVDPGVRLSQHSYQAGLWDADMMALHQYAEGLRRGLDRSERLSSVNDAAEWIERITQTNFSRAVQIVDWTHASEHVWGVGKGVFGEGTPETQTWVNTQLDGLWTGAVQKVITTLDTLEAPTESGKEAVRQAGVYFRNQEPRMHYADYRAAGYPIGSGTVESAANTVVHHRMRRPGRGWKRDYAQAMLAGLSELHSGRFDRAWQKTVPVAV
jgi:hypothetical protein